MMNTQKVFKLLDQNQSNLWQGQNKDINMHANQNTENTHVTFEFQISFVCQNFVLTQLCNGTLKMGHRRAVSGMKGNGNGRKGVQIPFAYVCFFTSVFNAHTLFATCWLVNLSIVFFSGLFRISQYHFETEFKGILKKNFY